MRGEGVGGGERGGVKVRGGGGGEAEERRRMKSFL